MNLNRLICWMALLFLLHAGAAEVRSPYRHQQKDREIHRAIRSGDMTRVEALLEGGYGIANAPGNHGHRPLYVAVEMGDVEMARLLLDNFAHLRWRYNLNDTAWDLAIEKQDHEIIELFVSRGAELSVGDAARLGKLDLLREYLEHDRHMNPPRLDGNALLLLAAKGNQREAYELILSCGIKPSFLDKVRMGDLERVNAALEAMPQLAGNSLEGTYALHVAAVMGRVETGELLLSRGARRDVLNNEGFCGLHLAAYAGHAPFCRMLLQRGAPIDLRTGKRGFSALYLAAMGGHLEVVTLLVESKADVNFMGGNGETPLHAALSADTPTLEMVKFLVEKGADVNHQSYTAFPLTLAEEIGEPTLAEYLREKGAVSRPITRPESAGAADIHTVQASLPLFFRGLTSRPQTNIISLLDAEAVLPHPKSNALRYRLDLAETTGTEVIAELCKKAGLQCKVTMDCVLLRPEKFMTVRQILDAPIQAVTFDNLWLPDAFERLACETRQVEAGGLRLVLRELNFTGRLQLTLPAGTIEDVLKALCRSFGLKYRVYPEGVMVGLVPSDLPETFGFSPDRQICYEGNAISGLALHSRLGTPIPDFVIDDETVEQILARLSAFIRDNSCERMGFDCVVIEHTGGDRLISVKANQIPTRQLVALVAGATGLRQRAIVGNGLLVWNPDDLRVNEYVARTTQSPILVGGDLALDLNFSETPVTMALQYLHTRSLIADSEGVLFEVARRKDDLFKGRRVLNISLNANDITFPEAVRQLALILGAELSVTGNVVRLELPTATLESAQETFAPDRNESWGRFILSE